MWPTADWPFIDQYPVRHLEQIHNTKDSIEPKRLIAIPDAPNAQPLEYEYLRMLERAGQEIYWVKDGDHLVEINIRQLLRSVESEFHRRGSGGSVTNINIGNITIGDGANVGDIVLASEIQKSFNKAEAADIQTELKETLKQLAEAVNVMSNQLPGERAAEAVEDLTRLVEEATKPAPNRKWYSVSIEGLIKAADNVEKVGEPVINLSQKVFSILTGGIGST
jgi:hypothetical protein